MRTYLCFFAPQQRHISLALGRPRSTSLSPTLCAIGAPVLYGDYDATLDHGEHPQQQ